MTTKRRTTKAAPPPRGASARETKGVQVEQALIDRVVAGVRSDLALPPLVWMGPNQPLKPLAQEDAVGRLKDYAVGYNLRQTPRHDEVVSFDQLRALSENCDILRIVIETRKDQIESIDWDIQPGKDKKVSPEDLAQVKAFFLQPSTELDWSGWVRSILEDLFVLDAVALYPRLTRGGDLYSIDVIDAATIKRIIDDGGRTPIPPDPAYQQQLHGVPAVNYTADELIYFMRNPRTHKFYGYSPVEQIITMVNIAIRKALHQLQYYTEGNIPESIAGVPDTWTTEQIKEFQMYWDALIEGDTAMRRKMRFVPLDPTKIKETRQLDLKDMFDEWLARVVCYAFSISPSAFVKDTNRATAETVAETARKEGLSPLLRFVKRRMDLIIAKYMGRSDIEFNWQMDEDLPADIQANVDKIYVDLKVLSPDEVREERFGKPPLTPEQREAAWPAPPSPFGADGEDGGKPPFGKPGAGGQNAPTSPFKPGAATNPAGRRGKPAADDEQDAKKYGIGKLVISPVINIPERNVRVDVGDVNVTAQLPD